MKKNELRESILYQRKSLSNKEVLEKSKIIIGELVKHPKFRDSSFIMCYADFRNEVMTLELINYCFNEGKRVAVPFITGDGSSKEMVAAEIFSIDEFEKGSFGILEPTKKNKLVEVDPKDLELIVVPGVAFDYSKNRIGYGGGYFDKFLKKTQQSCFKVGLAFDIQMIEKIPVDDHDIRLDAIITESKMII